MYLIVLGAGPVGDSLIALALGDGHDVTLIEADENRAKKTLQRFDCMVIQADVAQGGILAEANADRADALVATTEDDSSNLMAMFLGTEHGINTLISVVNDQRHQGLFRRLGVHVLVDPEDIIAKHLYGVLRQPALEDVVTLPNGAEVFEITVGQASPLAGTSLDTAGKSGLLPKNTLIVSLKRGDETMIPCGTTVLQAGDGLTVFAQNTLKQAALTAFTG